MYIGVCVYIYTLSHFHSIPLAQNYIDKVGLDSMFFYCKLFHYEKNFGWLIFKQARKTQFKTFAVEETD